jgi:polygalacturonase
MPTEPSGELTSIEGPGRLDGAGLTASDSPDSGQGDKQIACKSCDRLLFRNLNQTKGGHFFYLLTDCKNVTIEGLDLSDGRPRSSNGGGGARRSQNRPPPSPKSRVSGSALMYR